MSGRHMERLLRHLFGHPDRLRHEIAFSGHENLLSDLVAQGRSRSEMEALIAWGVGQYWDEEP